MKKRFDRSGTARRKAVTAIAALTMALVLAVGGAGAATLLSAQPETLTVGAVVPHITAEAPQQTAPADPAPAAESTATAPEQAAESTAQPQQAESVPEQAEKPEIAEAEPAEPEEAAAAPETPETPAQPAGDAALEEENSPAMLLEETPELAAQDPQAPAADDLKWPPRCSGYLQRKAYLYFAFVAPCGARQTHFHEKGRNGKRHLKTAEVPF